MAERWETKALVSTLSSSFFPSFLALLIPWDVSIDTSVGAGCGGDCLAVCSGMRMVMVCFIPDLDQALQGRRGWRNRDASLLLGLFPAAAVSKLCRVPFCLLWGKPVCVDPFGHGASRTGHRCLLQERLCLFHAPKAAPIYWDCGTSRWQGQCTWLRG